MITTTWQRPDILQWLQGRHMSRITLLINILLVIWLASMLASLSWRLLSGSEPEPVATGTTDPVVAPPVMVDQATIAREVADWHLFGETTQEPVPVVEAPVDAPDTRLNLVLHGTILSPDPGLARAIVADTSGTEEHYSIGDKMPSNTTLSEIYADRIILMRNRQYETLRLPKEDILFGKNANVSPQSGLPAGQTNRRSPSRPVSQRAGNSRSASQARARPPVRRPPTARSAAGNNAGQTPTLQSLKENPASLLGMLQPEPVREGDAFVGFRLKPGQGGMMAQFGLEADDVVTQINDVRLDSPEKGFQALDSLSAGGKISLLVLRGGEELAVTINLP